MRTLTPDAVYKVLKDYFPAQNDNYQSNYVEELKELNDFGITTEQQLVEMVRKRADEVMEIDRSPMSDFDIRASIEDEGEVAVRTRLRKRFWFSFPALLRIALELEFGKAYEDYADKRDGVT